MTDESLYFRQENVFGSVIINAFIRIYMCIDVNFIIS